MNEEILSRQLDGYLAVRAALRSPLREANLLRRFVLFAGAALRDGQPLGSQVAVAWACSSPRAGAAGRARRLVLVRGFLVYVRSSFPSTEIPPPGLLPRSKPRRPHIFSGEEIAELQRVARELVPRFRAGLRPATYVTLIGLLASCGLRVGEALRLTLADVQISASPPMLVIRETKFGKSRLVPLHPSTASVVEAYIHLRRKLHPGGDRLFVSDRNGGPLNAGTVRYTFRRTLLPRAGILGTPGGARPVLHGLRHTFAVRRIEQWQRDGEDVRALLPSLSVYMGHVDPANTYWYLTVTPEILGPAAESFERYASEGGPR